MLKTNCYAFNFLQANEYKCFERINTYLARILLLASCESSFKESCSYLAEGILLASFEESCSHLAEGILLASFEESCSHLAEGILLASFEESCLHLAEGILLASFEESYKVSCISRK